MKPEEILNSWDRKNTLNQLQKDIVISAMNEYAAQEVKRVLDSITVHIHTSSFDIHFEKSKP